MATNSHIEWTDMTWNPVTGCTKISQGCKHCYAERLAHRLHAMGLDRYRNEFKVTVHPDLIDLPRSWKKPRMVFVNSMSDLFHEDIPTEYIKSVFKTMVETPQHKYQILTKRSERLRDVAKHLDWPNNIWMGVSVEDMRVVSRITDLATTPAKIKFLSCEPLIGPLDKLPLKNIDWVIVGGESGPKARPMKREWVTSIFRQCRQHDVAFFFKQWGGTRKSKTGRTLHGKTYDEFPSRASISR
ncbi:MAG TPA: phage Gp37/Gp68 family protein [Gammaproteobacteria bacterium]